MTLATVAAVLCPLYLVYSFFLIVRYKKQARSHKLDALEARRQVVEIRQQMTAQSDKHIKEIRELQDELEAAFQEY